MVSRLYLHFRGILRYCFHVIRDIINSEGRVCAGTGHVYLDGTRLGGNGIYNFRGVGTGYTKLRGMRLCGNEVSHASRDHKITQNPA